MKKLIGDFEMYFKKRGKGERTVLMLHGNGENSDIFDAAAKALKQNYTVYTPDTRGHGRSGGRRAEYHYAEFADDFLTFARTMKMKNLVVFGFSDGAIIALLMALKSDVVKKAVLCGLNTDAAQVTFSQDEFSWVETADENTKALFRLMLNEPHVDLASLADVKIPVLLCFGEHDVVTKSVAKEICASLPNAELKFFEGEDHGSYVKRNEKVAELIMSFDTSTEEK